MQHKRPLKHKLLLDECCPVRKFFPRLNDYHHLEHVVEDCKKSGLTDPDVYKLACTKGYVLITLNEKDFSRLVKNNGAGIIGISGNMKPDQIDSKLMTFFKKHSPKMLKGKYYTISS